MNNHFHVRFRELKTVGALLLGMAAIMLSGVTAAGADSGTSSILPSLQLMHPPLAAVKEEVRLKEYSSIPEKGMDGHREAQFPSDEFLHSVAMVVLLLLLILLTLFLLWSRSLRRQVAQRTEELQKGTELQRAMIACSPVALYSVDMGGIVLTWNDSAERVFGWTAEEVIGKPLPIVPEDKREEFDGLRRLVMDGQIFVGRELIRRRKDGSLFHLSLSGAPIHNNRNEIIGIMAAASDITERKHAEDALVKVSSRQQALLDAIPDIIMEVDSSHIYTWANQAGVDFFGDDVIGRKAADYFIGEQETYDTVQPLFDGDENVIYIESRQRRKDGEGRLLAWWCRVLKDSSGTVTGALSTARDITELSRAEQELRESEEKYRTILESIEDGYWEVDIEGRFTFFNDAMCRMAHRSRKEMMGLEAYQDATPETRDKMFAVFTELSRTGNPADLTDYEMIRWDGTQGIFEMTATLMRDKEGNPLGFRGVTRDITKRRQTEAVLRKTQERYRMIVERMTDVVWLTDMDLRTTFVTPSVQTILGFTVEEQMQQSFDKQLTPDSVSRALDCLAEELAIEEQGGGDPHRSRTLDLEYLHKDGSTRWMEATITGIRDEDGALNGLYGVSRDITDRKKAEEDLFKTLERLRQAFNATIQVLVSAVEIRDPYTAGHQMRVAHLTRAIAAEMGFNEEERENIYVAGLIHDIGKLSVPAETLSKPTKLTPVEFNLIKEHPRSGYKILKTVETDWPLAEIVHQHHERIDGSGYPRNLQGNDILMEARILAVADVVEAMASHRPWREALGIEMAIEEIEHNQETLYDAAVVQACIMLFREKGYRFPDGTAI